jgi:hypothetical protein
LGWDAFYGGGGWAFRGAGSATVREMEYTAGTVERNTKKLNKATTRMFAEFPPGSNKKK